MLKRISRLFVITCIIFCASCSLSNGKKIGAPIDSKKCIGENYNDIVLLFEKAGFKNIEPIPEKDIKIGVFAKEDEVFEVSISLNKKFKKDDAFYPDDKVKIKYHKKND